MRGYGTGEAGVTEGLDSGHLSAIGTFLIETQRMAVVEASDALNVACTDLGASPIVLVR